jgi:hypothetical protein
MSTKASTAALDPMSERLSLASAAHRATRLAVRAGVGKGLRTRPARPLQRIGYGLTTGNFGFGGNPL